MITAVLLQHLTLSVLHLAVALHLRGNQMGTQVEVPRAALHTVLGPKFCHINVGIVVIAETVTLLHLAVGVTHIALSLDGIASVVVDGIFIDIGEPVATQQVVHRLVVESDGVVQISTGQQFLAASHGVGPSA